jgi:hydrogenase nickel incorporation protein HypA/HybF
MHELSICQALVEQIRDAVKSDGNVNRVISITVEVGELSCIEPEALKFSFDTVTHGTELDKTKLVIKHQPIVIKCLDCNNITECNHTSMSCKYCEGNDVTVIAGKEFLFKNMEVD